MSTARFDYLDDGVIYSFRDRGRMVNKGLAHAKHTPNMQRVVYRESISVLLERLAYFDYFGESLVNCLLLYFLHGIPFQLQRI